MKARPQTIQIFLPAGDPRGLRIAEITTRIVQVIDVPRSLLGDFFELPERDHVALYFLVGESEEDGTPKVYIGQTGSLRNRLTTHHQEKDFWQRALVLISRTHSLTQTHALFLEWHCLQECRKAGRYTDANSNSGSRPHTPAPLEADCLEIYETGRTLLASLGHPIFEPVATSVATSREDEIYSCRSSGIDARGLFTPEGFVVLKGSVGRRAVVPSSLGKYEDIFRRRLIDAGVMREEGETVVFNHDHLFGSPSMAVISLLGRAANGWKEWKNKDGVTLDALKRQPAESKE